MLLRSCLSLIVLICIFHVFLLQGPCQHPWNHCQSKSSMSFSHSESHLWHPKNSPTFFIRAGFSSPQLTCRGICTGPSYRSLSTPGQWYAKTLFCTGHRGTEMRASPCRAEQTKALATANVHKKAGNNNNTKV